MCSTCGCGQGSTPSYEKGKKQKGGHRPEIHEGRDGHHHHHDHHHHGHGRPEHGSHDHNHIPMPCGGSVHIHIHVHGAGDEGHHTHHQHGYAHSPSQPHSCCHSHDHDVAHDHANDAPDHHRHRHSNRDHNHDNDDVFQRVIRIEQDLLAKNDKYAALNRLRFLSEGIFALNLVSSPGSGKTTLLVDTVRQLKDRMPVAVIEGDQQTDLDAERIRETGVSALQVNTGKGCHLDAKMIAEACDRLDVEAGALLLVENVGNLVCPASFDLGEAAKVVILSVTEGQDKPLKYPDMFAAARLMILSKTDLLAHVDFDPDKAVEFARRINPDIEVICLSSATGEGFDQWLDWIARTRT